MGDQNDCHSFPSVKVTDCLKNFLSSIRIQHCSWLIQNDAFRTHCHDTGNCNPLLLSAGKFIRRMITIGCHSCFFQALIYTLPDFLCGHTHILRSESYVFFYYSSYDLIVRILKNHARFLADFP